MQKHIIFLSIIAVLLVIAGVMNWFGVGVTSHPEWKGYTVVESDLALRVPVDFVATTTAAGTVFTIPTSTSTAAYFHTHLIRTATVTVQKPTVSCDPIEAGTVASSTRITLGGHEFTRDVSSDVGAGNLYQSVDYTTSHHGQCQRISLLTHSTNGEGFYSSDAAQIAVVDTQHKQDMAALYALFDEIMTTVKFN